MKPIVLEVNIDEHICELGKIYNKLAIAYGISNLEEHEHNSRDLYGILDKIIQNEGITKENSNYVAKLSHPGEKGRNALDYAKIQFRRTNPDSTFSSPTILNSESTSHKLIVQDAQFWTLAVLLDYMGKEVPSIILNKYRNPNGCTLSDKLEIYCNVTKKLAKTILEYKNQEIH
jgi:hypothetical protein